MQEKIHAYIDSYEYITVLLDKDIASYNKRLFLVCGKDIRPLEIINMYEEYQFFKIIVRYVPEILLHKEYYIIDESNNRGLLRSGSIIRTKEFEDNFSYDGPLGFEYSKEKTIFRIWSPVAKEIILELHKNGKKERIPYRYIDKGLWEAAVTGDLDGYGYLIYVRVFEKLKCILDPYAISSAINGKMNYVIDINKLYKMKYHKPDFSGNYTDAIIYEASIRDFTYDLEDDYKGTFLGMLENNPTKKGEPTGLEYIKSLGVTHMQLLPTNDFGGVDDSKKNSKYNWGYNPEQYFIPCGWYSVNPNDPYSRLNELLELIDNSHKLGLRVVMDVVFNHVYKYELFAFDNLVPGYFFRVEADGRLSNATGCGNVLATERYMASRFIIDVLEYYTKVFNVSGYRFDLMGLLDVDTLNKLFKRLVELDDKIILYGEGWNMMNPLPDEKRPHMFNHHKIPNYGFFNDRFRDFIRGSQWNKTKGFALGEFMGMYDLNQLIKGSCIDYYKFNEPTQTINYVECHDNYTFYDYCKLFNIDDKNIYQYSKLALQIVLISQGVPFIHAGQEFFRTKQGVENSYKSKDSINKLDYRRRDRFLKNVNTIKDLIAIRKEYDVFRLKTAKEISNRVHQLDGITSTNSTGILLEDKDFNLIVVVKNNNSETTITLDDTVMIYDSNKKCNTRKKSYVIASPGVYIFRKEKKKWN